jgi:hypothetical protein
MLRSYLTWLVLSALVAGCAAGSTTPTLSPPAEATDVSTTASGLVLAAEPPGAKGVLDARKESKDGDAVVVVGRVGGSTKPFTGRASFTIVDPSLKVCTEDGCPTPWDYCCEDPDDLARATALVKFVDGQGKTLAADARALLGLKEMQTVVVRGTARRDQAGNLTVLADGLYRRPEAN